MTKRRNEFEPPGNGLPAMERFILNFGLKFSAILNSSASALDSFTGEADKILEVVKRHRPEILARPYVIPRVMGIEDSSRGWSILMVIKHLCMANRAMLNIISALAVNRESTETISIADLKPPVEADMLAVEDFRLLNQEIETFVKNHEDLRTEKLHPHPWFGELTAHQWLCLAAAHQKIHRRQCDKILSMMGIV